MAMAAPAAVRLLIAPGTWTAIHKPTMLIGECVRRASSSSSSTWKQRQANDPYARQAKVKGLRSRAAFKLLEIDSRYDIFKRGQLVVDLGYAPGSWSQVAMERTKPHGRVIGIDLIPAQPPKGVTAIQGNFLSPGVQYLVKEYLNEFAKQRSQNLRLDDSNGVVSERPSYIDAERAESIEDREAEAAKHEDKMVDVILSDMMMNTSGNGFRDHVRSMDLCHAALNFASETLRPGGHFICKFYHGAEDKILEANLKNLFTKVYREKPEASRVESREGYFVAMRRKKDVT